MRLPMFFHGVALFSLLFGANLKAFDGALDYWHWRSSVPDTLRGISFINGSFFAGGERGTIATSQDATNWTYRLTQATNGLCGFAYGNGKYIAVGGGGVILISDNGAEWGSSDSPTTNTLRSVVFANGIFVAVGDNSLLGEPTILTSTDGMQWEQRHPGTSNEQRGSLHGVTFGNGHFVASGAGTEIVFSTDGITWTNRPGFVTQGSITFGNNLFVAVGSYQVSEGMVLYTKASLLTSSDGQVWTRHNIDSPTGFTGVAYGNGRYVAIQPVGRTLVSENGQGWSFSEAAIEPQNCYGIAFGNGHFVAVGLTGKIITSTDGVTWVNRQPKSAGALRGVAYGNGQFVAVDGTPNVLISSDGTSWKSYDSGLGQTPVHIIYAGQQFVAFGGNQVMTSKDGIHWVAGNMETFLGIPINDACYGNGTYVGVSYSSVMTSSNGLEWSRHNPGPWSLGGTAYGNGLFVVCGGNLSATKVWTSTNGRDWTEPLTGTTNAMIGNCGPVAFGNGKFVVSVYNGDTNAFMLTSSDGSRWDAQRIPHFFSRILFANGLFVAYAQSHFYSSSDGLQWTDHGPIHSPLIYNIAYGRGTVMAVGQYGTILQSSSLLPVLNITSMAGGNISISAQGLASGSNYRLQVSSDLVAWQDLLNSNVEGPSLISTNTQQFPNRFYRIVSP